MSIFLIEGFNHLEVADDTDVSVDLDAHCVAVAGESWKVLNSGMYGGRAVYGTNDGVNDSYLRLGEVPLGSGTHVFGFRMKLISNTFTETTYWYLGKNNVGHNYTISRSYTDYYLNKATDPYSFNPSVNTLSSNIFNGINVHDGNWHYIEVSILPHGTNGVVICKVDGVETKNETGLDTSVINSGSDILQLRGGIAVNDTYTLYDDIYIADSFIENAHNSTVKTLVPTGDGDDADWTQNTGSTIYETIDDIQYDGNSTYIDALNSGDKFSVVMSSLGYNSGNYDIRGTIHAIQTHNICYSYGIPCSGQQYFRYGGIRYYSSGEFLFPDNDYASRFKVWEVNPVNGSGWTHNYLQSPQFGLEKKT